MQYACVAAICVIVHARNDMATPSLDMVLRNHARMSSKSERKEGEYVVSAKGERQS